MPEEKPNIVPEVPRNEPTPELVTDTEKKDSLLEVQGEKTEEKSTEKFEKILSAVSQTSAPVSSSSVTDDATAMGPLQDAETAVQKLVDLAQVKGVAHAVAVAQKLNDLYVLDTMHDTLADKLGEALTKKGLIESL